MWTTNIHRDLVNYKISESITKESLTHRLIGIQLLNRLISAPMGREETEIALLIVMHLALSELNKEELDRMMRASPLPFDPPLPTNDFNVLARLRREPTHGPALVMLIRKMGAWENMKMPGLAPAVAMSVIGLDSLML